MKASLTGREREIALQAAAGRTNREIGEALGISARTVEWNLGRVYRKLGVSSRGDLAAPLVATPWAFRPSARQADRPIGKTENTGHTARSANRGGD